MHRLKTHKAGLEGQPFYFLGEFSGKSSPALGFGFLLWYKLTLASATLERKASVAMIEKVHKSAPFLKEKTHTAGLKQPDLLHHKGHLPLPLLWEGDGSVVNTAQPMSQSHFMRS